MPNLKEHQYRVAAVSKMVCDNLKREIDKEGTIAACLFHDMGNIIKFDLERFPEFTKEKGLDYWLEVQKEYILKYGEDEHGTTFAIAKELNLNESVREIIDNVGFSKAKDNLDSNSFEFKIAAYADMRVGPHGILSLRERLDDLKARYANRPRKRERKESSEVLIESLHGIERQIFEYCSIKPEEINDVSATSVILELQDFKV